MNILCIITLHGSHPQHNIGSRSPLAHNKVFQAWLRRSGQLATYIAHHTLPNPERSRRTVVPNTGISGHNIQAGLFSILLQMPINLLLPRIKNTGLLLRNKQMPFVIITICARLATSILP